MFQEISLQQICEEFSIRSFQNECFLCTAQLTEETRSKEHVIPCWIQRNLDLWNRKLCLLNRTSIPYRQLTIPCCSKCNNEHLSGFEEEVSIAFEKGFEAVKALPDKTLFYWLGKIFYGILYKEISLKRERDLSNSQSQTILSTEEIRRFSLHHLFLQGVKTKLEFSAGTPASIFMFETQPVSEKELKFDLIDDIENLAIYVRINNISIVAALQDGSTLRHHSGDYFEDFINHKLHPVQMEEIAAQIFCFNSKLSRTPKFLIAKDKDSIKVHQMPIGGLSRKPLYDNYEALEYAKILSHFTRLPLSDIYFEPDSVYTWLKDKNGAFPDMSIHKYPYPLFMSKQ